MSIKSERKARILAEKRANEAGHAGQVIQCDGHTVLVSEQQRHPSDRLARMLNTVARNLCRVPDFDASHGSVQTVTALFDNETDPMFSVAMGGDVNALAAIHSAIDSTGVQSFRGAIVMFRKDNKKVWTFSSLENLSQIIGA